MSDMESALLNAGVATAEDVERINADEIEAQRVKEQRHEDDLTRAAEKKRLAKLNYEEICEIRSKAKELEDSAAESDYKRDLHRRFQESRRAS